MEFVQNNEKRDTLAQVFIGVLEINWLMTFASKNDKLMPFELDRISVTITTHSEMCKKIGSPPSFGEIKPCPFSRQNALILPKKLGPAAATSDLYHEKQNVHLQINYVRQSEHDYYNNETKMPSCT